MQQAIVLFATALIVVASAHAARPKVQSPAPTDAECIACHGGETGATARSYALSKHGIIARLELESNRAPRCATCHVPAAGHRETGYRGPWTLDSAGEPARIREALNEACGRCHAPRYVAELAANGARMLEIGRMKLREGAQLVALARRETDPETLAIVAGHFKTMQDVHLRNLWLGVAHQSPDYQWWHGQAALDGDLIRIKGALTDYRRVKQAFGPSR